jgi:hypothetical protein
VTDRRPDALTLALIAWTIAPRTTTGTLTIKLSAWYGRITADPIAFTEEGDA